MSFKAMLMATLLEEEKDSEFLCSSGVLLDQGQGQQAEVLSCAVVCKGDAENSHCSESSILCQVLPFTPLQFLISL